jgi:hypothetical protein
VALLATMALFAAAFIAMRSVRLLPVFSSPAEEVVTPTIIRFEPPPIAKPRPPKAAPRAAPANQPVTTPTVVPTVIAPTSEVMVAPPIAGPPTDSGSRGRSSDLPTTFGGLIPRVVLPNPRTVPAERVGVNLPFQGLTDAQHDSAKAFWAEIARRPLTKEEKDSITRVHEPGRGLPNTRAGSDGKAVPLMNGGVSVGMASGQTLGGSFSLPLFSRGPSAAQRKRNEAADSVNRLILYRLQERARALRDSLRADSLAKRIRP